jgi:outer membrane protein assembly factor BamB
VGWVACSSIETYRHVLGTNGDMVVVQEGHEGVGHTVALDASDGGELWRWPSLDVRMPPGPVAGSGVVVVATGEVPLWDQATDAELVGIDAVTGQELWRIGDPLEVVGTSETVVAAQLYSSAMGSQPIAGYDRMTGEQLWVSEVMLLDNSGVFGGVQPTAASGDLLVVPTGDTATAMDLTSGEVRWVSADLGWSGCKRSRAPRRSSAPSTRPAELVCGRRREWRRTVGTSRSGTGSSSVPTR